MTLVKTEPEEEILCFRENSPVGHSPAHREFYGKYRPVYVFCGRGLCPTKEANRNTRVSITFANVAAGAAT